VVSDNAERYGAYFGESWEAPVNEGARRVPTPVDESCLLCGVPIAEGDRGVFALDGTRDEPRFPPEHIECSLRSVLGGIGHLEDHEHWCLGQDDPDGGHSYRDSALLVWAWAETHGSEDTSWL